MKRFLLLNEYGRKKIIDTNQYIKGTLGDFHMFYKQREHNGNVLKSNYIIIDNREISLIKEESELLNFLEVGDLVEIKSIGKFGIELMLKREFLGKKDNNYIIDGLAFLSLEDLKKNITKIYKKNKDDGYDLSWEVGK